MNPQLIIVEGPDCVGKTTFVKSLAQSIRKQRVRVCLTLRTTCSKSLIPGLLDYQTALFKDISENIQAGYMVILDRSWPSEEVYRPIFRPKAENFTTQVKQMAERFQPTYIFLERDDVMEVHKANKDKAHPYTQRQFAKVVKGYKQLAEEIYGDFFYRERTHIFNFKDYSNGVDWVVDKIFAKEPTYAQIQPAPSSVRQVNERIELANGTVMELMGIPASANPVVLSSAQDEIEELKLKESMAKIQRESEAEERAIRRGGNSWEEGKEEAPAFVETPDDLPAVTK